MTNEQQLARVDAELLMIAQAADGPAWWLATWHADWLAERKLIEREAERLPPCR